MKKIQVLFAVLFFPLLSTFNVFAAGEVAVSTGTVITTQTSKFTLTPLENIPSESGLKSAGRTAEIAVGELNSNIQKLAMRKLY